VVNLGGGHTRWREASLALISKLTADEQNAILGGTALKFYDLSASVPTDI